MRFCKCVPVAFSSVSIYKTRSRRQNTFPSLLVGIKFVKTRSRRKILTCFSFNSLDNWSNCRVLCVSILRSCTSTKKIWKLSRNGFFCKEAKAFVEITFPSLLAWLQFVKTRSRRFCHFFATGTCFDELKMQEILKNCLWKHVLIAKNAQKRP